MRFSIISTQVNYCKRIEDVGSKCRHGEFPKWADAVATLDGYPGESPGLNSGLIARAIRNDPMYLAAITTGLPREDSLMLISDGLVIAQFSLVNEDRIIPLGLGSPVHFATTMIHYRRAEGSVVGIPGCKLAVRVTLEGKVVELLDSPTEWGALFELFPLETLLTLPRRPLSPKQPIAGAWAVAVDSMPEVPKEATKHVLEGKREAIVTARGITKKEVKRRVQRTIDRLGIGNAIYRKDLLQRR